MDDAYSPHKIVRHLDIISGIREARPVRPAHVQLIISDTCNQSCRFCAYRDPSYSSSQLFYEIRPLVNGNGGLRRDAEHPERNYNPHRMIPYDKILEILDDCEALGVSGIQLSVWGEERIAVVDPQGRPRTIKMSELVDGIFGGPSADGRHEEQVAQGWKAYAISDEGEIVLDSITRVYRHAATEPLYRVTLLDGRSVIVTASHSLNAIDGNKIVKKRVIDLSAGDEIACATWIPPKTLPVELPLPVNDHWAAKPLPRNTVSMSPELFRLLGYYTAEGSGDADRNCSLQWIFGNGPREQQYIDDLLYCIKIVFGVDGDTPDNYESSKRRVYLHSVCAMRFVLEDCGAGGTQARRQIPWVIWSAPTELQIEYLKGLFSGDGNFRGTLYASGQSRNSIHLKTCNRDLAHEAVILLRQLGVRASVGTGINKERHIDGRTLAPSSYYSVNVYDKTSLERLLPVVRVVGGELRYQNSPHSHAKPHRRDVPFGAAAERVPIKKIEIAHELGLPMVYDVTVADTHRFLTSSGIGAANTGGGEPTVHPKFMDIVAAVLERKLALALVSNGVQVGKRFRHDPRFDDLFGRVAWTRISIDAGSPTTYAKIRNVTVDHFDAAWAAVSALRHASDLSSLPHKPIVGVGFVVTPNNWQEVMEACILARTAGAHNIRISAQFSTANESLFKGFHLQCAIACAAAERTLSDDKFKVYNRFSEKLDDLRQKRPDYDRCGYQHVTTYIGGDLNVYRCCVTSYNPVGLVGSLVERRFMDVWMSQARVAEMDRFDAKSCDRCQFNGINRFLDYALRPDDPQHFEFV